MKFIASIFLMVVFAGNPADTTDFYPEKQAVKQIASSLKEKEIQITEIQNIQTAGLKNEFIKVYRIKPTVQKGVRYAIFTQAKGRYDLFDYLVITDEKFAIKKVNVVKYRSEHGGEIGSKKWLEQFENYSGGKLEYAEEISVLSGATISAMSLTRDIPKVIEILKRSIK